MVRYWMTREIMEDELSRLSEIKVGGAVVVELGCSRGQVRRSVGELPGLMDWVGLDIEESAGLEAMASGITRFIGADFDSPFPLDDGLADMAVFIHVLEHLPRPGFTLGEIARILKPGGLLIAGSPVAPWPISSIKDLFLKRRLAAGGIPRRGHIQAFSPGRWRRLLKGAGLVPEFASGAFFLRRSGCLLEDSPVWFRLNLAWGALFPSLGGELYLTARKPISETPSACPGKHVP
jgi:SAM-dependent methyltransferase